jgi:hypothetical protein
MTQSFLSHEQLLDNIIALEERMFRAVKASTPSECQQQLPTFRTMRRMAHCVLSDQTLASYLQDLREASEPNTPDSCCMVPSLSEFPSLEDSLPRRNFFTEKYARIEDLIPPLNDNPAIDKILAIESAWFRDLQSRYPRLLQTTGAFERYARAELETYSDRTLSYHLRDIEAAQAAGRNLVEERYTKLCEMLKLGSLAEAEALPVPSSLHPSEGKAHVG